MSQQPLPPHNIEAEQSVLGSILIAPSVLITLRTALKSEDFYREAHRLIYAAMLDLADRNMAVDFVTLSDYLGKKGRLEEIDGSGYLLSLIDAVPTAVHAGYYADIVRRCSVARRYIQVAGEISGLAYTEDFDTVETLHGQVLEAIYKVREGMISTQILTPTDRADRALSRFETARERKGQMGVPFGFRDVDKLTGGMFPEEVVIVCGNTGIGKSAFLAMVANHVERSGKNVLYVSAEMPEYMLTHRELARRLGVTARRIREADLDEEQVYEISNQIAEIAQGRIFVYEGNYKPSSIEDACREMALRYGLDLVVIDYLQIMQPDRYFKNRTEAVDHLADGIRSMARRLGVPVIVGAQLNRELFHRKDKRPTLSDVRESGKIEQNAFMVLGLHRESYYSGEPYQVSKYEWESTMFGYTQPIDLMEVIVLKNRSGPENVSCFLGWRPAQTEIYDPASAEEDWDG